GGRDRARRARPLRVADEVALPLARALARVVARLGGRRRARGAGRRGRQAHVGERLVHAAVAVVVLAVAAGLVADELVRARDLDGGAVVAHPTPAGANGLAARALAPLRAEVGDGDQAVVVAVDLAVAVVVDAVAHL